MAKIEDFSVDSNPTDFDRLLGSNSDDSFDTSNYRLIDVSDYVRTNILLSDINSVIATSAELNKLAGSIVTTQEINYLDGLLGPIQTLLNEKQDTLGPDNIIIDNAIPPRITLRSSAGPISGTEINRLQFDGFDANSDNQNYGSLRWTADDVTAASIDSSMEIWGKNDSSDVRFLKIDTDDVNLIQNVTIEKIDPTLTFISDEDANDGNEIGAFNFFGKVEDSDAYKLAGMSVTATSAGGIPQGNLSIEVFDSEVDFTQATRFEIERNRYSMFSIPSSLLQGPELSLSAFATNFSFQSNDARFGRILFSSNLTGTQKDYTRILSAGELTSDGYVNNYIQLSTRDEEDNSYTDIVEFRKDYSYFPVPVRIGTDATTHEIDGDIAEALIALTPLPDGDGTTQTSVLQTTGALGSEVYSWAASSGGGSFDPSTDQTISGDWRFTGLFALPSLSANPTGEYSGQQYYNFTDDEVRVYDAGTSLWTAVGGTPFDYTADLTLTKTDPTIILKSDETADDGNEVGKLSFEGLSGSGNNVYAETVVTALDESAGEGEYSMRINNGTSLVDRIVANDSYMKIGMQESSDTVQLVFDESNRILSVYSDRPQTGATLSLTRQIATPTDESILGVIGFANGSDTEGVNAFQNSITARYIDSDTTDFQFQHRSGGVNTTSLFLGSNDANYSALPLRIGANASANELDDYEEGTWTPVAGNLPAGVTLTVNSATYTKIGRQVNCYMDVSVSATTSTFGQRFETTALPFTANTEISGAASRNNSGGDIFLILERAGFTGFTFHKTDTATNPTWGDLGGLRVHGNFTYTTTA